MICPNCGTVNNEGNRFCGNCGAALVNPSAPAVNDAGSNPFEGGNYDVSAVESLQNPAVQQGTSDAGYSYDSQTGLYRGEAASAQDYSPVDAVQGTGGQAHDYGAPGAGQQYGYGAQNAGGAQYGYADPQQGAYYSQPGDESPQVPQYAGDTYGSGGNMVYSYGLAPRSIAVAIILSIVTCGIYQIYWLYKINEEINQLADDPTATGGGMVILFTIITCGIYQLYWAYKMGEKNDQIKGVSGSSGILMLVLALFGLNIVNLALLQDTINKMI